mmetsp:Transcript_46178/g.91011  ORF Transcript_46178/g.91011 Transcript_46178/m.91011 type:complete len:196 (+) Transcript_46178:485-1072(+)
MQTFLDGLLRALWKAADFDLLAYQRLENELDVMRQLWQLMVPDFEEKYSKAKERDREVRVFVEKELGGRHQLTVEEAFGVIGLVIRKFAPVFEETAKRETDEENVAARVCAALVDVLEEKAVAESDTEEAPVLVIRGVERVVLNSAVKKVFDALCWRLVYRQDMDENVPVIMDLSGEPWDERFFLKVKQKRPNSF